MTNEELIAALQAFDPALTADTAGEWPNVHVEPAAWPALARELRSRDELCFDYLFCLSGADFPEYMTVVYHLESTKHMHQLVMKVRTAGREKPEIDTVCDIWLTAEFHEREAYDMYGIRFKNHPDLRRLLLWEGWGFPLRKDYVDEVKIVDR